MRKEKPIRFPHLSHLSRRLGRSAAVPSGEATSRRRGRGAGLWKCQKSCHHREQQVLRRIAALKDEEAEGWRVAKGERAPREK